MDEPSSAYAHGHQNQLTGNDHSFLPEKNSFQEEMEGKNVCSPTEIRKNNMSSQCKGIAENKSKNSIRIKNWQILETPTALVEAVHCMQRQSEELQIDRHKDVEADNSEGLRIQFDRREPVNVCHSYDESVKTQLNCYSNLSICEMDIFAKA